MLRHERKQAICSTPWLSTEKEVCELLRAAGFCQIWILGFSEIAKPLFEATAGSGKDLPEWGSKQEKAFREMKRPLTGAPALGLLDVTWDFNLVTQEKSHTALGSSHRDLGQESAQWLPVQQLDPVAAGWLPCLWALTSTVFLVREVDKLTLGQNINVKVPHSVAALMNSHGHKWLTNTRMTHY